MPFTRAGARLQGSGPTIHAARRDPRGNPLLRFPPSPGFVPARLAARLSTCGTSPGIPAPTALSEGGVYVASAGRIRPVPTTCRPQGSGPLDGLLLHPPCRAFRPGSTPGVLPTGCFPLEQARRLPPTGFPSWRFSPSLRTRDLGITRTMGATPDDLVVVRTPPFTAYRVLLRPRVRTVQAHLLSVPAGRSPLGLRPP